MDPKVQILAHTFVSRKIPLFAGMFTAIQCRRPPTINPGLIFFRKRFLMGLYKGGLYTGGGLIHGQSLVLVMNKSVINSKINMYSYICALINIVSCKDNDNILNIVLSYIKRHCQC